MDVVATWQPAFHAGVGSAFGALVTYLVSHASFSTNTLHAPALSAAVDSDNEDAVEASADCPIHFQFSLALASDHSFFIGGGFGFWLSSVISGSDDFCDWTRLWSQVAYDSLADALRLRPRLDRPSYDQRLCLVSHLLS
jgi:hypothetical protein